MRFQRTERVEFTALGEWAMGNFYQPSQGSMIFKQQIIWEVADFALTMDLLGYG